MFPAHASIDDDEPLPEEGEDGAYDDEACEDGDALEALRDADVATLERMQGMAEDFATWLHRKGAEQMEAGGDKAVAQVRQLSHSFNRAARAVRQIMVLKEEAAGLRPTPHARAAAAANQNGSAGNPGRSGGERGGGRDRRDLDDYDDDDETREAKDRLDAYIQTLLAALQVDIDAAGPEKAAAANGQSNAGKLTKVVDDIPHPNLDATLARLQLEWLHDLFWLRPEDKVPRR